jgi:hypothetical protein
MGSKDADTLTRGNGLPINLFGYTSFAYGSPFPHTVNYIIFPLQMEHDPL